MKTIQSSPKHRSVSARFQIPRTYKLGAKFKKFVKDCLFPEETYAFVSETPTYQQNETRFIESSLNPDFKFRDRRNGREFWVEAKFRSSIPGDILKFNKPTQMERFRKLQAEVPVFILLGIGGFGQKPKKLFLIPLSAIPATEIPMSSCEEYSIEARPVSSKILWCNIA